MENKNLFSIGEIAKAAGITRKIILNYEAKGLITPDKKEGKSGNRLYTIDTFTQIRTIRVFQNLGLSLDEIREYFNNSANLEDVIKRLEVMRRDLDYAINRLKEKVNNDEISVKEVVIAPQTIYCRTYNSSSILEKTNLLRDTALDAMKKYGTNLDGRLYFTEHFLNSPDETAYCISVPDNSKGKYIKNLPELKALSIFHYGPYENIHLSRQKLIEYAKENNIHLSGVFRNLYHEGPPQHKDKNKFITQIFAIID